MGESMWAQFCADIENDSSAEREISATQWHSHGIAHYNPPMGDERRLGGEDWVGILTAPQALSPLTASAAGSHPFLKYNSFIFYKRQNLIVCYELPLVNISISCGF